MLACLRHAYSRLFFYGCPVTGLDILAPLFSRQGPCPALASRCRVALRPQGGSRPQERYGKTGKTRATHATFPPAPLSRRSGAGRMLAHAGCARERTAAAKSRALPPTPCFDRGAWPCFEPYCWAHCGTEHIQSQPAAVAATSNTWQHLDALAAPAFLVLVVLILMHGASSPAVAVAPEIGNVGILHHHLLRIGMGLLCRRCGQGLFEWAQQDVILPLAANYQQRQIEMKLTLTKSDLASGESIPLSGKSMSNLMYSFPCTPRNKILHKMKKCFPSHLHERVLVHRHTLVVYCFHITRANQVAGLSLDQDVTVVEMFDEKFCTAKSLHELHLQGNDFGDEAAETQ